MKRKCLMCETVFVSKRKDWFLCSFCASIRSGKRINWEKNMTPREREFERRKAQALGGR